MKSYQFKKDIEFLLELLFEIIDVKLKKKRNLNTFDVDPEFFRFFSNECEKTHGNEAKTVEQPRENQRN